MNDILYNIITSTVVVSGLAFIFKNVITEKIKSSIKHSFDIQLLDYKKKVDKELKELEIQLRSKSSEFEALVNNNLSALDYRREKQIHAIEVLWNEMIALRHLIPGFVTMIDNVPSEFVDTLIKDKLIRSNLDNFDLKELLEFQKQSQAYSGRLFSGDLLYSYFELYQSIVSICLMNTSSNSIDGKFTRWHEKYNVNALFPNASVKLSSLDNKLGKTQAMLKLIEESFLSDAERIINGEVQLYEGKERAAKIRELAGELAKTDKGS
ncbi:hypothetical protein [Photobacterium sanguinicancri]|uniref:hypothetical protein n=1 Tax=Photobacterium sanguinicancri TaxID=875932 RepID=UPI003D1454DF